MPYSKNSWSNGDTITKAKLDNIENGVGAATAPYVVYADNVPAGSGLSNVIGDGTSDDKARLQAQLDWLKTNVGNGGVLQLPRNKQLIIASGLTLPAGIRIHGDRSSILKYTATTGAAITVNDGSCTPLVGFKLYGPGTGGQGGMTGQGTSVGLSIYGARMNYYDLEVRYFNWGVDMVHPDTYIHYFNGCVFGNNEICIQADIEGRFSGTAVANSGERLVLEGCLIDNSRLGIAYSANGASLMLTNTSVDYCWKFGKFQDVYVLITNCHLESSFGATPNGYLFELLGNAKLHLSNTAVVLGGKGIYKIVNNNGPANYNGGMVQFDTSTVYFMQPNDNGKNSATREVIDIPAGATTYSTYSPWVSKWAPIRAEFVYNDGRTAPAGLTAAISSIDSSVGQVNITFSAAVPTGGAFLSIRYS